MVGSAGNAQGLLSMSEPQGFAWISAAFNFQGIVSKSQHKPCLVGSSPGISSFCFPYSFCSLSYSFPSVTSCSSPSCAPGFCSTAALAPEPALNPLTAPSSEFGGSLWAGAIPEGSSVS